MLALVIRDTGQTERLEYDDFAELQKACGGTVARGGEHEGATAWFEHVDGRIVESPSILNPAFAHLTMWANEEGRLEGMRPNLKATIVVGWWEAEIPEGAIVVDEPDTGIPFWMLVGDIVITGPTDRHGNRTTLAEEDAAMLEQAVGNVVFITAPKGGVA